MTEFIATGDPVGSRTLARKYGLDLSAASIRNVLADLEEGGYLKQPHTSAGRIPTDRALRLFIDTLVEVRALSPRSSRPSSAPASPRSTRWRTTRCARPAATCPSSPAPPRSSPRRRSELRTLSQLRFIPTQPGQMLAVLVFSDGTVENRFIASTRRSARASSTASTTCSST